MEPTVVKEWEMVVPREVNELPTESPTPVNVSSKEAKLEYGEKRIMVIIIIKRIKVCSRQDRTVLFLAVMRYSRYIKGMASTGSANIIFLAAVTLYY